MQIPLLEGAIHNISDRNLRDESFSKCDIDRKLNSIQKCCVFYTTFIGLNLPR